MIQDLGKSPALPGFFVVCQHCSLTPKSAVRRGSQCAGGHAPGVRSCIATFPQVVVSGCHFWLAASRFFGFRCGLGVVSSLCQRNPTGPLCHSPSRIFTLLCLGSPHHDFIVDFVNQNANSSKQVFALQGCIRCRVAFFMAGLVRVNTNISQRLAAHGGHKFRLLPAKNSASSIHGVS